MTIRSVLWFCVELRCSVHRNENVGMRCRSTSLSIICSANRILVTTQVIAQAVIGCDLFPPGVEFKSDSRDGSTVKQFACTREDDLLFYLDVLFIEMIELFCTGFQPLFVIWI
jgi:hypothetical protein